MGNFSDNPRNLDILLKFPSPWTLFWGFLRIAIMMVFCIMVWKKTGLETQVGRLMEDSSQSVADFFIEPVEFETNVPSPEDPNILVPAKSRAQITIHAATQSHQNFAIFIPLILLAALPLRKYASTLGLVALSTVWMFLLQVILIVTHSYFLFNDYLEFGTVTPDLTKERLMLLSLNYIILPSTALFISGLTLDITSRFFSARAAKKQGLKPKATKGKIGRNDICHCGSGKKYKKCCGRAVSN